MSEYIKALQEFEFAVPLSAEVEKFLKGEGYSRRNGTCTYTHNFYVICPLKKWYWPAESYYGIQLDVEKVVTVKHKLKVTQSK